MLRQRIITALVLLAILVPAVFYPQPWPFAAITLLMVAAAAWEWALLNQCGQGAAWGWGTACALCCALSWYLGWTERPLPQLWLLVGGLWVLLGVWLLAHGVAGWQRLPVALRRVGGVLALWVAWLAVVQARRVGINFLFSVLVLVWVADVFAYFAGRGLGGRFFARKLAPSISPGKTWEGACGGTLGVLLCAFAWRCFDANGAAPADASLYSHLAAVGLWYMACAVVFLSAMSVVGDLVESLFKRSAGVKDSSQLLPGHGGVLDRVDALLPTLPLAMMLYSL